MLMSDHTQADGVSPAKVGPVVSIGLPVFNGGKTLGTVFDTLLGQSFIDFELIVSDNASTDDTRSICASYAERDWRIRYVRQEKNEGAEENFRYVFSQSRGEYFMWAAADDVRSSDFLAVNLDFLRSHPEYVGSTSPVRFEGGAFDPIKMGDCSLDADDPNLRLLKFLRGWHANGRFYSLLRRQAVATWPHLSNSSFLGADWTLVTHLASMGKLHRTEHGWVELGREGLSNSDGIFARYRRSWLDWVVPFHRMSSDTLGKLKTASLALRLQVLGNLAYLNFQAARAQIHMHRRAAKRMNSSSSKCPQVGN